ncbi:dihydrolipoamide acetyltransferase family protein [Streptomyces sp. NPDC093109]|uniref:dihydrolipoamide acetyltransferase family protein n=1 Tax=Streptomyces sp. NPDC093109 TaxID=3154977 RepID=UPI00344E4D61
MAQVLEFKLPDLGEGLTEAEIVRWLVAVGDVVAVDQPVVEVETAKAMVEVPCPYGGVVTARYGEEGTELPVGAPLLTVAVGAAERPAAASAPADAAAAASVPAADTGPAPEASGNVLVGYGTSAASSRRRRIRPPRGTASTGRPVNGTAPGPVPVVSPLVRRLAREHGVDLRGLTGSGRDGLILRCDVEQAIGQGVARTPAAPAMVPPAQAPAPVPAPDADAVRVPLRGVRGAIADKLARSRREIPDATCWVDADATELMAARAAMNAADGPKISLLALLARICTAALARHPELNATVDPVAREIVRLTRVHLGFAAQTDRGLVVPVVRDAHARSAESLSAEFARLTEAGRTGTLTPAELTGGTFTLNNYGVFGVDGSTPIINHPEAAMLGVGRIVPKPWVHQGELAVRQVVQLSLTFDHRVCDGGTAGGFLRYVADCVEQPVVLLRTL